MFLTEDEVKQLTGYSYAKYQVRWLMDNHIAFKLNSLGEPVVLRSVIESQMTGNKARAKVAPEPNFGALKNGKKTHGQPGTTP